MLGFSLWCALCSGLRLSLTLGTAEFIQNLISFFLSKQDKMDRHRRESLFLLCVIEFNASCAASQGGPGWKGTYPIARNNVGRHSSTLFIFADISFNAHDVSHTTIFCSILLKVYF